ncbi:helix-turn-helix domain-containing protein [Anaerorhabdus furcosa]|uniref:AraC-type DNA-binding protein n=1 Tax=Anaerorhabdus furcosa TaxID=118967 RepID=A0A1T4L624_9FIRM|nr:AraC family transcriptional regulator [Anaerorhabdus furcosa]SJZ50124.1 AraC-type DNA-binding protein [Anaerorhabdus furcosa]
MINQTSLKQALKHREVLQYEEDYAYLYPCDELKPYISNITITFPTIEMISNSYTVLPHGSVTVVLFHYKNESYSFLFGPSTKPQCVGQLANQCDVIFIIEFQPAGFYSFSNLRQNELKDKIIPFEYIDSTLNKKLCDIFISSLTVKELLSRMEETLKKHLLFEYPNELKEVIKQIIEMKGMVNVDYLSHHSYYSSRHLNRLFNQYLGISMKSFSRIVKMNKAIQLLNEKDNSLFTICEQLNYYDVSHFVREFKLVCKLSPQQYRENMSDFYNEITKY